MHVSCTVDYLDECVHAPVEEVPTETFNVETKMQNHVVSAVKILLRISTECPKRFSKEVLGFLHLSVLLSFHCINDLLTPSKCKEKLEISVCDKLFGIEMILELS